ncbi:MAG: M28 family peptidase [Alphaproteobacteria bacterium]
MKAALAAVLALVFTGPVLAQAPSDPAAIRDRALTDTTAWTFLASLTTEVGNRQAGSPKAEKARDWGVAKLTELGFSNVHVEAFPIQAWHRGAETAQVVGLNGKTLKILGLGRSVPTPAGGIEAPVEVFSTYAALQAAAPGSLAGKIVLVNQVMPVGGYGVLRPARTNGASEAAKRGAVAYLIRSLSTAHTDLPHTGAMTYAEGVDKIPAAAISTPDADMLALMASRGEVRIRLSMTSSMGPATGWSVVGEIPGATRPNEVIVVGGHLDSWDVGQGAVDDGAGMAVTVAGAKLAASGGRLSRTLRVVLFGAEEMDYSGQAYLTAHRADLASIVLASESDTGAGGITSVRLPARGIGAPVFAPLAALLAPLNVTVDTAPSVGGGDDVSPIIAAGVPGVSLTVDSTHYFDWHHSDDDTLDKVDPARLNQMVAAFAVVLNLAANSDQDFRPAAP